MRLVLLLGLFAVFLAGCGGKGPISPASEYRQSVESPVSAPEPPPFAPEELR